MAFIYPMLVPDGPTTVPRCLSGARQQLKDKSIVSPSKISILFPFSLASLSLPATFAYNCAYLQLPFYCRRKLLTRPDHPFPAGRACCVFAVSMPKTLLCASPPSSVYVVFGPRATFVRLCDFLGADHLALVGCGQNTWPHRPLIGIIVGHSGLIIRLFLSRFALD
jgi:hypothetical protein